MKRTREDITFSKLMRESWDWHCAYCGIDYSGNRASLHCSHVFGRRHKNTRWHPLNAFAHCAGCHRKLGENPLMFAEHYREVHGDVNYHWLMQYHHISVKWAKWELNDLNNYMKRELKHIEAERRDGKRGFIPWTAYAK